MLSIHFTLPQVVAMLRTIVDRDPSRIAQTKEGKVGCVYGEQTDHIVTPVCIIGQMFADLGLLRLLLTDPANLSGYSDQYGTCSTHSEFWTSLAKYGISADEDAKEFMRAVQQRQDGGATWGDAYNVTRDEYVALQTDVLDARQFALDDERQNLINLFA